MSLAGSGRTRAPKHCAQTEWVQFENEMNLNLLYM